MTIGVLVMAYGTPTTPQDVEAYYTRIRHGRPPSPEQLADLQRRYNAIGGTSPLAQRSADQVAGLAAALERHRPGDFDVRFGSKYEPPLLETTAESFRDEGFDAVVGLVLAPALVVDVDRPVHVARPRGARRRRPIPRHRRVVGVPGFPRDHRRTRATTRSRRSPTERRGTTEVIFSAHSLPEKILETRRHLPRATCARAPSAPPRSPVSTAGTSPGSRPGARPTPGSGPTSCRCCARSASRGVTDVVSCPIGFVSDHLEVLFDIDIEAQGVAREVGLNLVRTASLNDDPAFMTLLADVVLDARRVSRESIVVVGGGISGLSAAWELSGGAQGPNDATPRDRTDRSSAPSSGAHSRPPSSRSNDRPRRRRLPRPSARSRRPGARTGVRRPTRGHRREWRVALVARRLDELPTGLVLGIPTSSGQLKTVRGLSWRARLEAQRDEHRAGTNASR